MDNGTTTFNREEHLKTSFNCFWNDLFSNTTDYYSQLDLEHLLKLKGVLSTINNIITLKLTLRAADFLLEKRIITPDDYKTLIAHISAVKPNANGYDIEECFESCSIIAEVKSNLPCGAKISGATGSTGRLFGANQLNNILKDIESLSKGKQKARHIKEIGRYLKFMFILDCDEPAIDQILKKSGALAKKFEDNDLPSLTTNVVYIVPLKLG